MLLYVNRIVALVVVAMLGEQTVAQVRDRTRVLPFADLSVAERLSPDDEVVILSRDDSDRNVTEREPTAVETIKALLDSQFGNLAIVDVTGSAGTLVDGGRWINTQFEGTVVDTVASRSADQPKLKLPPKGSAITFSVDGGEVKIGKVVVKTNNAVSFPAKHRYLVFLGPAVPWGTGSPVAGREPLLVEGNRLTAVGNTQPRIAILGVADVVRMAREHK